MDNNRFYVDLHVLQTVPPSCVNRDDTGSPKTAIYGGTTRARISSQSWKHAMRQMFREELLEEEQVGVRTKKIVDMVADEIMQLSPDADAQKLAQKALENAGLKIKNADKGTDALFFLSRGQAKALAELAVAGENGKNQYKAAIKENPSIDMALFGRMVANDAQLNYDAAAQVAHSISTHAVQNEYDYFTAVDDYASEEGAGHLGTIEYNSATLYRYATINVQELYSSLQPGEVPAAVRAFAESFIRAMPTGKQNTFANRTLPDVVYVTIRLDQPVNLCGAFEKAIPSSVNGFVEPSKQALVAYAKTIYENYTGAPTLSFAVGEEMEALAQAMSLPKMLEMLEEAVREKLEVV